MFECFMLATFTVILKNVMLSSLAAAESHKSNDVIQVLFLGYNWKNLHIYSSSSTSLCSNPAVL